MHSVMIMVQISKNTKISMNVEILSIISHDVNNNHTVYGIYIKCLHYNANITFRIVFAHFDFEDLIMSDINLMVVIIFSFPKHTCIRYKLQLEECLVSYSLTALQHIQT